MRCLPHLDRSRLQRPAGGAESGCDAHKSPHRHKQSGRNCDRGPTGVANSLHGSGDPHRCTCYDASDQGDPTPCERRCPPKRVRIPSRVSGPGSHLAAEHSDTSERRQVPEDARNGSLRAVRREMRPDFDKDASHRTKSNDAVQTPFRPNPEECSIECPDADEDHRHRNHPSPDEYPPAHYMNIASDTTEKDHGQPGPAEQPHGA